MKRLAAEPFQKQGAASGFALAGERWRRWRGALACLIGLWAPEVVAADWLWLSGQPTPLSCQIEEVTPEAITWRGWDPAAGNWQVESTRQRTPRAGVERWLRTLDLERLASLSPERPAEYREYAEELAAIEGDGVAALTSARLLLLAARWGDEELRRGALRQLLEVAPRIPGPAAPARVDGWRSLAAVFDPRLGLHASDGAEANPDFAWSVLDESLWQSLRQLRTGRGAEVADFLLRPEAQARLASWDPGVPPEELARWARMSEFTVRQWGVLLPLEEKLTAARQRGSRNPSGAEEGSEELPPDWSRWYQGQAPRGSFIPRLQEVSPWDLEAAQFRDGTWQRATGK